MKKMTQALKQVKEYFTDMDNIKADSFEKIKKNLDEKYEIPKGVIDSLLARPTSDIIEREDIRLVGLFIKESFKEFGDEEALEKIFTPPQIKEMEQYLYTLESNGVSLPLELYPALKLNDITHSVKMSASMIAHLLENQILNYNYDIQREAKTERRQDEMIKSPKLNEKNIREMTELLVKEQLKDSTIYLNAAPRTAEGGDELIMDEKNHKLSIMKGTRLDILDGFHRCLASQKAYRENPDIDFNFNVVISNYTTKEAQTWQAQHAKAMPWSPHRVKELQKENRSDKVVAALRATPEIGEYINASNKTTRHQLTNFSVLSDAIGYYFDIKNRRDEVDVVELMTNCLDDIVQYEIDWGTPRKDNMITSSLGITGIIYYISKGERPCDPLELYSFLDIYKTKTAEAKQTAGVESLNMSKVTKAKAVLMENIVEEVESSVQSQV